MANSPPHAMNRARRRATLSAVVLLLATAGCASSSGRGGSSRTPLAAGAGAAPAALDFTDWAARDWRFRRDTLTAVYLFDLLQPADPWADYLRALRYDAPRDSLGLDDFLALPADERQARRAAAAGRHREALALRRARTAWWHRLQDNPGGVNPLGIAPEMAGDGVLEAIGHLVAATGLDPADAGAWYDLSFLLGAVGDTRRQESAQDGALAALAAVPTDDPAAAAALRRRLLLDRAWLRRDQGRWDEALAVLDDVAAIMKHDTVQTPDEAREAAVIRGLVLAEAGRTVEAAQIARALPKFDIPRQQKAIMSDTTWKIVNKHAFETVSSDFAARWIHALIDLQLGMRERALRRFMEPDYRSEFPPQLNYRFWNDVGRIREHFGEVDDARIAYAMAAVYRPLFAYFPLIGAAGRSEVYGQTGTGRVYFLGCRRFYVGGSLFSYAANRVLAVELAREADSRQELIACALDALDACARRGIRPAATLALRGRVHFRAGQDALAMADLAAARDLLRKESRDNPDVELILGILRFNGSDYAGAVPDFTDYSRLRPREGLGWRLLGLARLHAGQPDSARTAFDTAVRLDPESAVGLYNRGLLNLQQARYADARADLERARRLWPDNQDILRLLELANAPNPPRVAISHDDLDVTTAPDEADSLGQARRDGAGQAPMAVIGPEGLAWLGIDAKVAAERAATLRLRYERDRTEANLKAYAWCLLQAGKPKEVRDLLGPRWPERTDDEEVAILLRADRALGLPARARYLAKALHDGDGKPADSGFWELVAAVCLENGEKEAGRLALERALALDPGNAGLRRLQSGLGS